MKASVKSTAPTDWTDSISQALADRRDQHLLRIRRPLRIIDSTHVEIEGRRFVNFASNNYLGLTHHPRVISAFETAVQSQGVGSGAAPLVTGQTDTHASAERAIANWKRTESAVLLSSGYAANLAVVQMLAAVGASRGVRFLIDKLCHASLLDGIRAVAGGNSVSFRVFPHNHLAKLERLLQDADFNVLQVVVTESIFSMDGDAADLPGIAALKQKYAFLLVLDEAHGSGVYGPAGSGYAAELGLDQIVDIAIITLSKAMGCIGGAICGSEAICQAIINFGRAYIFSTALPPAVAAAVEASIWVMNAEPDRQQRVRELARRVRENVLQRSGDCPIIPIVLGDESKAMQAVDRLMSRGFLTLAVRPPTVPRGASRLRITLSCDHTNEEIDALIQLLNGIA